MLSAVRALLAVEHCRYVPIWEFAQARAMWMVFLVVVANEVVELIVLIVLLFDLPVEESAEGIALYEAVEQRADLLRLPNELPLYGWQDDVVAFDPPEGVLDRDRCLVHP